MSDYTSALLFQHEHEGPILDGTKRQTRRLWDHCRVTVGKISRFYCGGLPISPCPDCDGLGSRKAYRHLVYIEESCPVCHGTGRLQPFAERRIIRVWQERLGDISEADALAEGGYTHQNYIHTFKRINGKKRINGQRVRDMMWADLIRIQLFCIEFEGPTVEVK